MITLRLTNELPLAAELLRKGGLVSVPTETVYGLAANGLDAKAVEKIYVVKGRPPVKPLALMIPGPEAMDAYAENIPPQASFLAERFWPGPLSIVLKARSAVPEIVRAGGETVSLRCPAHPITLALLRESGIPFAAPSANPSGSPSPRSADEVLRYFDGQIDAVIDGGVCEIGTESTLLDLSRMPCRVLRRGALSEETIADALVEHMTVFGVTGGSGSGKTTALRVLEQLGALVIDADSVYHELLACDRSLIEAISARFPEAARGDTIDRRALSALVFQDAAALKDLNDITHPAVISETIERLRRYAMNGGTIAAIDAIGLIGSGLDTLCDRTYAVVADRETRIRRIMTRDGLDREQAERRIAAQRPDDYFVIHCGSVLRNDADEAAFTALCRQQFTEDIAHG